MAVRTFLNDERASVILEWILGLFGVFCLIVAYAFFIPFGNILINVFVENGAPLAQMLWFRTMAIWAFAIMGVLCLMYPFAASYLKVHDPGLDGGWGR